MRVFITGATGFVGRALTLQLLGAGHEVVAWVRDVDRARSSLGDGVELVDASGRTAALEAAIAGTDAVINLAGEPIVGKRWSRARKAQLVESRVAHTDAVVSAIRAARLRGGGPSVLVSASAIGYYGDRGDEVLAETSPAGPDGDFLATLCDRWERAAENARDSGVRVVTLRVGIVLGREGGALATMAPMFRAGIGGRIGSGRQWMSWIHLHDLVNMIDTALGDERWSGPINAVAPAPVENRQFARALGGALERPVVLRVPSLLLKTIYGEAATTLLSSQRVEPARLRKLGFRWRHADLSLALHHAIGPHRGPRITARTDHPANDYLDRRGARYLLKHESMLDAPIDEVVPFFSRAENLGVLTPPWMGFAVLTPTPIPMAEATEIDYRIALGPVSMRWKTVIDAWDAGQRFVDSQARGPYRSWWHEHSFEPVGDRTRMVDRVWYSPPLGFLGRIAHWAFIESTLTRIFAYRSERVSLRFGRRGRRLTRAA
jgi:uncharacterized protein (TIGR01777 family)